MNASIIIPAYNEEHYILKTIEAAAAQQYAHFEIIVVDNNSTDRTAAIVKKFATHSAIPIKLVHEHNKGTQWARERGRREANGSILAYLDADCLPSSQWLEQAANVLSRGCIAVSGPYDYYDAGWLFGWFTLAFQKIGYTNFNRLIQKLKLGGIMIAGNSIITAASLEKVHGFNTDIIFYGDDTDTARKLTQVGKVIFDPNLIVKSSARRFQKKGRVRTLWLYLINFFAVLIVKKPIVSE